MVFFFWKAVWHFVLPGLVWSVCVGVWGLMGEGVGVDGVGLRRKGGKKGREWSHD